MNMLLRCAARLPAGFRGWLREWMPPRLQRICRGGEPASKVVSTLPEVAGAAGDPLPGARIRNLDEIFFVAEFEQAEAVVGRLFRRRYNTDTFPAVPRHFVGFYKSDDGSLLPLGYVHHTPWRGCSLCGGLVIDERMYRRVPTCDRQVIRKSGGIAEAMLRQSFDLLPRDVTAIWAHVGNKQSEVVCLRVGYRHTDSPYVMVIWRNETLTADERTEWVARVTAYGPF